MVTSIIDESKSVQAIKQCFDAYDSDKDGKVTPQELQTILRCLNRPYTDVELATLASSAASFDYYAVAGFANARPSTNVLQAVKAAFEGLSESAHGTVSADMLRFWLTTMGEELKDNEIDEVLRICDVQAGGDFNLSEYLHKLQETHERVHNETLTTL